MNKLLKTRTIQVIAAVMAGGILASVPFEHGDASNLSTTTLATKGQTGTGANDDIHKSQARTLSADGR
ncbi:MAG TPA: hypothetical protein VFT87_02900, partial [Candidatus Saccharimonadales bacterium]|nr:hypothetical protein [Candidatus Saccharimonadales bacterium]